MMSRIKKKVSLLAVSVFLTASLLTGGCSFLLPAEEDELTPPLMQPATVEYKTQAVAKGTLIQQLRMSATFYPETMKSLSFEKSGGRLKALSVENGQTVKAGDLIAELNSDTLASQIRIQELEVEKSQLSVTQLQENNSDAYAVKKAKLSLQQVKYQLEDLKRQLTDTRILSPIDGEIVYLISTAAGEYVNAYQTVARVADTSDLVLKTTADQASNLPIGALVSIEFQKMQLVGEVVANPSTLMGDPDASMKKAALIRIQGGLPAGAELGSDVRIIYIQEKREDVLVLPRNLINLMSGRRYVNVLEDGVRVEKDVEVGLTTDTESEIIKGLAEGDLVIIN